MPILCGDTITDFMRVTIDEMIRRRAIQTEYNQTHGITPETIKKKIHDLEYQIAEADNLDFGIAAEEEEVYGDESEMEKAIEKLNKEMKAAAKALEFEKAAKLRDKIRALRQKELQIGGTLN